MLPDMFMGAIFGVMIAPLSFSAGIIFGPVMEDFGPLAVTLTAIAITASIAFVCGAGFGFSVSGVASTDAIAISLGLGGSPLLASVPFLLLDLRGESLFIAAIILGLGLTQALGGYIGCTRSKPIPQRQLGIGHTCANCNYNLSATPDHQPCPECGRMYRLSNTPPSAAHAEGP